MHDMPDRAWAEIDLDAIEHNLGQIRKNIGKEVKINGVIKADGYGHGAIMTAKVLCKNGIDMLSVATLDEAIQLRNEKIDVPVLVLGYTDIERLDEIVENNVIVTVFDADLADELSKAAVSKGIEIKVHLKIDTGMNRIGFHYTDPKSIIKAYSLKGIDIKGTFTHFSTADEEEKSYTEIQYKRFTGILEKLRELDLKPGICHANNSGGTMIHRSKAMDMVRTGLMLYGLYPSEYSKTMKEYDLWNAMSFKARIITVKTLKAGEPVSYGNNYVTKRQTRVATIAYGYADGFSRVISGKAEIIINGCRVPLIGNICMDMCMADITDIDGIVRPGDQATVFNGEITADDIAKMTGTINYEIVCRIGMRIPRVYIENEHIVNVSNYLL